MGLLDWLTDGIGSSMEGSSMPQTMPEPPMPPAQQVGDPMTAGGGLPPPMPTAQPPLSFQRPEFAQGGMNYSERPRPPLPPGGDPMTAGGEIGNGPGLPPPPLPAARPASAPPRLPPSTPAAGPSALPPGAAPTSGAGSPPLAPPTSLSPSQAGDAYSSYKAAGGGGPVQIYGSNGGAPGGGSFIGRALGLDANQERSMFGGLGAGLTAAGNSKGKSKGQALFSGAGGALEGGQKAEDKAYEQRLKALGLDVKAKGQEDYTALGRDRLELSKQELKQNLDKMTGAGMSDSEKYVRAQQRAAADPESRGAVAQLKDGSITPEQFKARINEIKAGHLKGIGLDPNKAPPGDFNNPHRIMTRDDFDRFVQPGQAYINPKDGQVYIRKGASNAPAAEAVPAAPTPEVASTGTDAEDLSNGT